ncbi:MAG: PPC domain-containing DNA-binding protein [Erysipelotrichaceae bacterium]
MKTHAIRLTYGQDLIKEINNYANKHQIEAGCILSGVGCLYEIHIRKADGNSKYHEKKEYEIVSLMGTVSKNGSHLHISLSDVGLNTIGGHLCEGCFINTTAEIIILELENQVFTREEDKTTGYKELVIRKKKEEK